MHRWIARNCLFPLQEMLKGHSTVSILKEMEGAERLAPLDYETYCNDKLRSFIASCYDRVPYVRARMSAAGIRPEHIRTAADLSRLPLMTKADVRQHRGDLRSTAVTKFSQFSSGGSTGEPLVFDLSKRRISSRVACRQRVGRWWGVSVGDPELAIWGAPLEVQRQDRVRSVRDWLLASRLLSAYELNEETIARYIAVIQSGRWRQIFAYPSAIYMLCLQAQKQGRSLRQSGIRVVFVTSEVLYAHQRELISETFGCPVANGYGGRDSGFISHECPQGGMHILSDASLTEVVDDDGRPLPPGETGHIVVTDLYSEDAPFIRYVTGDIGALSARKCACGRPLPMFERIEGRSNDAVVTPDGRTMHGQSLIGLLMEIPGIERFRIYQKRPDRFHLQIVRGDAYRVASEDRIRRDWQIRLRAELEISFEYVTDLSHERSGKFRHIVSELPAGTLCQQPASAGKN